MSKEKSVRMRPIKFRVWDKIKSEMFQLELNKSYFPNPFDSQDFEIMQFTGLLDKNGNEIYEKDKVRVRAYPYGCVFESIVTYKSGGFWLESDYLGSWKEHMLEVIGNEHENK